MSSDQLESLNAELVDAITRLLNNRIPHDNSVAYAKSVVVKAEVVLQRAPIMSEDRAEYTPGTVQSREDGLMMTSENHSDERFGKFDPKPAKNYPS